MRRQITPIFSYGSPPSSPLPRIHGGQDIVKNKISGEVYQVGRDRKWTTLDCLRVKLHFPVAVTPNYKLGQLVINLVVNTDFFYYSHRIPVHTFPDAPMNGRCQLFGVNGKGSNLKKSGRNKRYVSGCQSVL